MKINATTLFACLVLALAASAAARAQSDRIVLITADEAKRPQAPQGDLSFRAGVSRGPSITLVSPNPSDANVHSPVRASCGWRLRKRSAAAHHFLGDRTHVLERGVRLLRSEKTRHDVTMIKAPWASVKGTGRTSSRGARCPSLGREHPRPGSSCGAARPSGSRRSSRFSGSSRTGIRTPRGGTRR